VAIDPYRTLGLQAGASVDDVKQAYRRLAKRYHPDAGRDSSPERFLAVQAAYEMIVGSSRSRGAARSAARAAAARPWQADPERAGATREAYRARTGRGGRAGSGGGPTDPWGNPGPGAWWRAGAGPAGATGPDGSGPSKASGTRSTRDRPEAGRTRSKAGRRAESGGGTGKSRRSTTRRKTTLTSTTYDDAVQQSSTPDWDGGAWYGPSSGTYWTINPREYADPRKHGPEYQARARRAAEVATAGAGEPGAGAEPAAVADRTTDVPRRDEPRHDEPTIHEPAASRAPATPPRRVTTRAPARPASPPSRGGSAVSAGLAAGLVALVPAFVVLLFTGMSGDGGYAAIALLLPVVVGLIAGLLVRFVGRARTT
jgi:hypothetical protein